MSISFISLKRLTILPIVFICIVLVPACNNNNNKTINSSGTNVSQNTDSLFKKYELDKIKLPDGFKIDIYAEIPDARSLCVSPGGTVFVGTRKDKVYAITDENHDGKADKVYVIASGLKAPNGVAFKDGSLYIGTISVIYRIDNIESRLANPPSPVVVYDKYPTSTHHGNKFIAFGPDGKLYVRRG